MATDVTPVMTDYLAGNLGPDPTDPARRRRPDYGVTATLTDQVLEITLTFRRGSSYCCYEWGCHIALGDGKRWDGIRRKLVAAGVVVPPRLVLRADCVVEEGALFFDLSRPDPALRGRYPFVPMTAHRYQATAVEAPQPD